MISSRDVLNAELPSLGYIRDTGSVGLFRSCALAGLQKDPRASFRAGIHVNVVGTLSTWSLSPTMAFPAEVQTAFVIAMAAWL